MFEYWIFADKYSDIVSVLSSDIFVGEQEEEYLEANRIWFFKAKNLFVIQSSVPFGDSNLYLDELLINLAKSFEIHDKGIIKSHWHASSFY